MRPIFRSLGDIAQATGCAIVLIGHLNKAAGTQITYRGLGSIDITAAVRSLLFIGKLKDSPTTRVLIHEKSSLAPPGQSLAFSLGDEKGFEWIGAYDITADELLAGDRHRQDPRARPHRRKCSFWNCLRTESVCRAQSWKRQSMSVGFLHAP